MGVRGVVSGRPFRVRLPDGSWSAVVRESDVRRAVDVLKNALGRDVAGLKEAMLEFDVRRSQHAEPNAPSAASRAHRPGSRGTR